jgi:hypothetical protein
MQPIPGVPPLRFFAKGGMPRMPEEESSTPPFAKNAKDAAPGSDATHLAFFVCLEQFLSRKAAARDLCHITGMVKPL